MHMSGYDNKTYNNYVQIIAFYPNSYSFIVFQHFIVNALSQYTLTVLLFDIPGMHIL